MVPLPLVSYQLGNWGIGELGSWEREDFYARSSLNLVSR